MALSETARLIAELSLRDKLSGGVKSALGGLGRLESGVGRAGKGVGQLGAGLGKVGLIAGGAAATGLGLAAKTAIDFQDAFAGVQKTVAGTPAELEGLNQQLRKLSTRIPVGFEDLAGIASEAGALGVPTKEVAGFTEVVARLSAATVGLTTDAAAEAFGKLGNVLNLHGKDFERAGSALVALGNAGASSEGDIIMVAQRFGAAGAQAKLSAAQVFGFSSAIASMGVEPEAAGSSLSRLFNNITKYIGTGDKKIRGFAKAAGLSVKAFSKFFKKDASGAVQQFLKHLSTLDRFKAAKLLKAAGVNNVRDINAILLLARGHKELKRQVDLSTDAYKKNTELAEVSQKRFDTLKARLTELKNSFRLAGVTLAEGFLPALGRSSEKLASFLAESDNQDALKKIGEDIGEAIDGINWKDVLSGARQFVDLMKGALGFAKLLFDAVNTLPTEIKAAGLGFIGLNKLSGGLVGAGLGNIAGGLAETIAKSTGSRLPGVGKLFAQPVFVTNWPLGGVPGGPGGPGGGGGLGMVAALGAAGLIVAAAVPIGEAFAAALPAELKGPGGKGMSQSQIATLAARAAMAAKTPTQTMNQSGGPDERLTKNTIGGPDERKLDTLAERTAKVRDSVESSKIAGVSATNLAKTGISSAVGSGSNMVAAAVRASRPIVTTNVDVHVSAGQVQRQTTVINRYGPPNGSKGHVPGAGP